MLRFDVIRDPLRNVGVMGQHDRGITCDSKPSLDVSQGAPASCDVLIVRESVSYVYGAR